LATQRFRAHSCALVAAFALGICAGGWASPAAAESLRDAAQSALRKNPEVLGAAANARAAVEAYNFAAAGRWPTVDFRVGEGREASETPGLRAAGIDSRTLTRQEGNFTLRQNLFDGAQVRSEMEREQFRLDSARSRLSETAEAVTLRVAEAYMDSLRDAELVRLAEETLAQLRDILRRTQLRFKGGVGQGADVAQAEARVALANSILISAQGAREDSAARYLRVVGNAPSGLTEPAVPVKHIPAAIGSAKEQASDGAYGIALARADLEAAKANVRAVRSDLYPRLDVELSANRNRNVDGIIGAQNDNQAMLVMRYNLFRGGADRARTREAIERETIAMENVNAALQSTEESVSRTWFAMVTARDRIPPLDAHVRASGQVRQAYREQFELGRRSLLDLVNAENEYYQARAALLTGRMVLRVAEYRLLVSVGAIVRSLDLEAEVQAIDVGYKEK
jgi:adhesin transport system outer membrane protein